MEKYLRGICSIKINSGKKINMGSEVGLERKGVGERIREEMSIQDYFW